MEKKKMKKSKNIEQSTDDRRRVSIGHIELLNTEYR